MQELRPGLWTWTAPHPDWTPDEGGPDGWERDVRSYAYAGRDALVLFDPLAPPAEIDGLASATPDRDVVVVLTCHWHARSAADLVERLDATVFIAEASVERTKVGARPYRLGDTLPGDVEVMSAYYPEEAILWIPAHRALVAGDVVLGAELGVRVQPDSWLPEGVTREDVREALRPLLSLPIELILPTHGDPLVEGAREALRDALEA